MIHLTPVSVSIIWVALGAASALLVGRIIHTGDTTDTNGEDIYEVKAREWNVSREVAKARIKGELA